MERVACVALAVILSSCSTVKAARVDHVSLSGVVVDFRSEDDGLLMFSSTVPAEPKTNAISIQWELWLREQRFAVGETSDVAVTELPDGRRLLRARIPLAFRHLGFTEGETSLRVRLAGRVRIGSPVADQFMFDHRDEVPSSGRPALMP